MKPKTYPRVVVTRRHHRWWWRIDRSPDFVEYACPHTVDTLPQAIAQGLNELDRRTDPVGHMVRAFMANFAAVQKANRRRSDYALAGPAKGA